MQTTSDNECEPLLRNYFRALTIYHPYRESLVVRRQTLTKPKGYFKSIDDSDYNGARTVLQNKRTKLIAALMEKGYTPTTGIKLITEHHAKHHKNTSLSKEELNNLFDEFEILRFT